MRIYLMVPGEVQARDLQAEQNRIGLPRMFAWPHCTHFLVHEGKERPAWAAALDVSMGHSTPLLAGPRVPGFLDQSHVFLTPNFVETNKGITLDSGD